MKINELIRNVSHLVASRETIDHGSIRCLYSEQACISIASVEGCDDVGTGIVGDDDLAASLAALAADGDRIAELYFLDLVLMENAFRGDDIKNYIDAEKEDELEKLDKLIDAARKIV